MKRVICKSGLKGWRAKLHKIYDSFNEFKCFCEIYGINQRLGYKLPANAWKANPTIQGSTNPSDLQRVRVRTR